MTALRASIAAAALSLASCINVTPPGILVSSAPPGARILVDGQESGFVTPANLEVDPDEDHWVELRLDGYATTSLFLAEGSRLTIIPWSEGRVFPLTWPFPTFLPAADLLLPVRLDESPLPSRVHVDMRLAAR